MTSEEWASYIASRYEDGLSRDALEDLRVDLMGAINQAVTIERERISKIVRSSIAIYRHNATVCPERKAEFDGLAESFVALDALIWNRYEDAR